jgi:hypothetical protein
MSLEIQKRKDGSLRSKWWYGRFAVNSKASFVNLGVEIKGGVPASLKVRGDDVFEHSRMKAQLKLDALTLEAQSRKTAAHHLQELYEIKSGEEIAQIPLAGMGLLNIRDFRYQRFSSSWCNPWSHGCNQGLGLGVVLGFAGIRARHCLLYIIYRWGGARGAVFYV